MVTKIMRLLYAKPDEAQRTNHATKKKVDLSWLKPESFLHYLVKLISFILYH